MLRYARSVCVWTPASYVGPMYRSKSEYSGPTLLLKTNWLRLYTSRLVRVLHKIRSALYTYMGWNTRFRGIAVDADFGRRFIGVMLWTVPSKKKRTAPENSNTQQAYSFSFASVRHGRDFMYAMTLSAHWMILCLYTRSHSIACSTCSFCTHMWKKAGAKKEKYKGRRTIPSVTSPYGNLRACLRSSAARWCIHIWDAHKHTHTLCLWVVCVCVSFVHWWRYVKGKASIQPYHLELWDVWDEATAIRRRRRPVFRFICFPNWRTWYMPVYILLQRYFPWIYYMRRVAEGGTAWKNVSTPASQRVYYPQEMRICDSEGSR